MNDDEAPSPSRRQLFKSLALVPIAAVGVASCARESDKPADSVSAVPGEYQPTFFNAAEWAFVLAACDRLIPVDNIGPSAGQAGVPEFIDRHMQTPYASGDIWYMQGPFVEAAPQFGYQGRLPVRDILRVGIKGIDAHCAKAFQRQDRSRSSSTPTRRRCSRQPRPASWSWKIFPPRNFSHSCSTKRAWGTSAIRSTAAIKTCPPGK